MKPIRFSEYLPWALCILCGLTLQVQVTLFSSANYLGLRLNATDLLLPFAGLAILFSLCRNDSAWPHFAVKHFPAWLAGLSIILVLSLANAYSLYGEISRWAFINKFLGWFILLATLGLGGWIGRNATQAQIAVFIKVFLYAALGILIYESIILTAQSFPSLQAYIGYNKLTYFPIAGLMANRNAYALLVLTVFALSSCFYFSRTDVLKPVHTYALYFMLPYFVMLNASRAGLCALAVVIGIILVLYRTQSKKIVYLLLSVLVGAITCYIPFSQNRDEVTFINTASVQSLSQEELYQGDAMRVSILKLIKPMIEERPVFGSGLGSVLMEQKAQTGSIINVVDSTPIWLIAEIGIIGLLIFASFYAMAVQGLWLQNKDADDFDCPLLTAILITVVGFSIMCIAHEIFYTRHIWFFLGLGLALHIKRHQAEYIA